MKMAMSSTMKPLKFWLKQALCHADAGAQVIAPSDMMDGRILPSVKPWKIPDTSIHALWRIRQNMLQHSTARSRDAVGSSTIWVRQTKKTHQMDPTNTNEALHEVALGYSRGGADMVMRKNRVCHIWMSSAELKTSSVYRLMLTKFPANMPCFRLPFKMAGWMVENHFGKPVGIQTRRCRWYFDPLCD